jgi:voltage-gated potassium channel
VAGQRTFAAYVEGPRSVRHALRVIVVATVVTTLVGGVLARVFDPGDFHNLGDAMWWSLQTVTTVGYGDITPKNAVGRVIGGVVLLYAVAFLSLLTAAITTTFIEQARRERRDPDEHDLNVAMLVRLDDIAARLQQIEAQLDAPRSSRPTE